MLQDGLINTKDNEVYQITNNKRKLKIIHRNLNNPNKDVATNNLNQVQSMDEIDDIECSNDFDTSPKKKTKILTTPIHDSKKSSLFVTNKGRKSLELVSKSVSQEKMVIHYL